MRNQTPCALVVVAILCSGCGSKTTTSSANATVENQQTTTESAAEVKKELPKASAGQEQVTTISKENPADPATPPQKTNGANKPSSSMEHGLTMSTDVAARELLRVAMKECSPFWRRKKR